MINPNVQVPEFVVVGSDTYESLENTAVRHGESAEAYIQGGLGIAALWGQMIEESGQSPDMVHGYLLRDTKALQVINVPQLSVWLLEDQGELALQSICDTTDDPQTEHTRHFIPEGCRDPMQLACVFYGLDPMDIINLAVNIRSDLLNQQREGNPYVYSPNGTGDWEIIELTTISEN